MEDKQSVDLYWARSEAAITETEKKYGRYCHSIAYQILYDDEARKAEEYLSALYGGLLRMEAPTAVTWARYPWEVFPPLRGL